MNINSVNLTGNLTRDPDLRELESGTKVANMRIAVLSPLGSTPASLGAPVGVRVACPTV